VSSPILAVTWWCQTTTAPWDWTPKVYLGVWLMLALFVVPYAIAMVRRSRRHGLTSRDKRAMLWYGLGVFFVWSASDWPLGTLGAGYLLSIHTVLYLIYTMVAGPLLVLGLPDWMTRGLLDKVRGWSIYRLVVKPWVAVIVLNGILVFTHLPPVVDGLRASQFGSFVLDALWLVSGVVGWLPIITPFRGDRIKAPIWRCVYLFIAFGAFPMLPGAFITFSGVPLYRVYELAPRFGDWSPLDDQQLAGALMKVGNIPILWAVIAAIFVKAALEGSRDNRYARLDDSGSPTADPGSPTADAVPADPVPPVPPTPVG
jgi:cytochrome c oxidase assembly factor CtaG